jgi:hypothetical protein
MKEQKFQIKKEQRTKKKVKAEALLAQIKANPIVSSLVFLTQMIHQRSKVEI